MLAYLLFGHEGGGRTRKKGVGAEVRSVYNRDPERRLGGVMFLKNLTKVGTSRKWYGTTLKLKKKPADAPSHAVVKKATKAKSQVFWANIIHNRKRKKREDRRGQGKGGNDKHEVENARRDRES